MHYETTTTLAPERAIAAAAHFFGKEFEGGPAHHDGEAITVHRRWGPRDGARGRRVAHDAGDRDPRLGPGGAELRGAPAALAAPAAVPTGDQLQRPRR